MINSRWLKMLVSFALLGVVVFTGAAKVADIPAGGAPGVALSHCLEGLREETGSVLPGQLADRDTCAQLEQIDAARPAFPAAAGGQAHFGLSSPAPLAQAAAWRDAGATRLLAAAAMVIWGDAGVSRR